VLEIEIEPGISVDEEIRSGVGVSGRDQ